MHSTFSFLFSLREKYRIFHRPLKNAQLLSGIGPALKRTSELDIQLVKSDHLIVLGWKVGILTLNVNSFSIIFEFFLVFVCILYHCIVFSTLKIFYIEFPIITLDNLIL